jgi:hypothetical protein
VECWQVRGAQARTQLRAPEDVNGPPIHPRLCQHVAGISF